MGELVTIEWSFSAALAREMTRSGKALIVDLSAPSEFATGHPKRSLSLIQRERPEGPSWLDLLTATGDTCDSLS